MGVSIVFVYNGLDYLGEKMGKSNKASPIERAAESNAIIEEF